jgi:hypothetical protein
MNLWLPVSVTVRKVQFWTSGQSKLLSYFMPRKQRARQLATALQFIFDEWMLYQSQFLLTDVSRKKWINIALCKRNKNCLWWKNISYLLSLWVFCADGLRWAHAALNHGCADAWGEGGLELVDFSCLSKWKMHGLVFLCERRRFSFFFF